MNLFLENDLIMYENYYYNEENNGYNNAITYTTELFAVSNERIETNETNNDHDNQLDSTTNESFNSSNGSGSITVTIGIDDFSNRLLFYFIIIIIFRFDKNDVTFF